LKFFVSIIGLNGLPGQAGLQGSKGERGIYWLDLLTKKSIIFLLGGTAPGFWGAVGVPGTRGRPGGNLLRNDVYLCKIIFLFI